MTAKTDIGWCRHYRVSVCREYCCLHTAELGTSHLEDLTVSVDMVSMYDALVHVCFQFFLALCHSVTIRFLLAAYANVYANINTL